MTAPGQLDLDGGEQEDPRAEKIARALWWEDSKRTWGRDGQDIAREQAKRLWPRVRGEYMGTARRVLVELDS